ncbi:protein adenylyltransferase SelO [Psychrobacter sp. I-STPA6b]|uniref:protein adenylyltransferase SelO n=1 Tax=Psychrobacter sp. I-STPA6b TaxID=2585718 RepID=UPI001D0CA455|nr:YdiU family protein [Psychrobacter sp. I-STPA6b]
MNFANSYATLDPRLYHKQHPQPLKNPQAGHFNPLVAQKIGWNDDTFLMQNWVSIMGGEQVPQGFEPLAMAYAGHQFGHWAGQLGDGRGLLMAQVQDRHYQQNHLLHDLHLKGAGLTPYSRMGDGRAVLRSTIREYLCGHAMSQLGIASSSALGFVTSETLVRRERIEHAAMLMRVSDCHIRLGHIEWIASFAPDLLAEFTDYMIDTYYPAYRQAQHPIADFLTQVIKNTAIMIANWQLIGFAHGVMNTDNLSITGSTIDYGPFGFMERFNPAWINNHSDHTGRYAYQNQPAIGYWNLNVWLPHFMRLQHAGINRDTLAECLGHYESTFMSHYQHGICKKIGLNYNPEQSQTPLALAYDLLTFIEDNRLDYSNSFRMLLAIIDPDNFDFEQQLLTETLRTLSDSECSAWQHWQARYQRYIEQSQLEQSQIIEMLSSHNPVYVLRNAMAQRAIDSAETGNFDEVQRLFQLLTTPYTVQNIATETDHTPPAPDAPDIVVSCSS